MLERVAVCLVFHSAPTVISRIRRTHLRTAQQSLHTFVDHVVAQPTIRCLLGYHTPGQTDGRVLFKVLDPGTDSSQARC